MDHVRTILKLFWSYSHLTLQLFDWPVHNISANSLRLRGGDNDPCVRYI